MPGRPGARDNRVNEHTTTVMKRMATQQMGDDFGDRVIRTPATILGTGSFVLPARLTHMSPP